MGCAVTKPGYILDGFESTHVDAVGFQTKPESLNNCADKKPRTPLTSRDSTGELLKHLTKKTAIVSDLHMFHMVDEHARNTPGELTASMEGLVTYLMSSCSSTLYTVRIFYVWILTHIRCETKEPMGMSGLTNFDPLVVLASRRASAAEMNLLFHCFCRSTSVPSVLIEGALRTSRTEHSSLLRYKTKPNHVWSMVLIQDQWRFIDCACATGLQDDPMLKGLDSEFFFLTDPEQFIATHFPVVMRSEDTDGVIGMETNGPPMSIEAKECLQMLRTPLKYGQFCQQPLVSVVAMDTGLVLTSHPRANVTMKRCERFAFQCPNVIDVAGVLRETLTNSEYRHSVLCTRKSESEFRVFIKPETRGKFKLSIYGRLKSSALENSINLLVDYFITVEEIEEDFSPFPENFGLWGANLSAVSFGFSRRIYKFDVLSCRKGEIYIKLPISKFVRARAVLAPAVSDPTETEDSARVRSTLTQYTEGVVHIKARFSTDGFHSLSLMVQSPDARSTFTNVAKFVVNCLKPSSIMSPYPKTFPDAQNFQCFLMEPLSRDLHVNETYMFCLTSPLLQKAKIGDTAMMKGGLEDDNNNEDSVDEDEKNVWWAEYTPTRSGVSVFIYGHVGCRVLNGLQQSPAYSKLYMFNVVEGGSFGYTSSTHL